MKLLRANVTLYTRVILQNLNTFKQFATFKFWTFPFSKKKKVFNFFCILLGNMFLHFDLSSLNVI